MNALDHRLNVYSDTLADARLRDKVSAAAFVDGVPRQVSDAVAPVFRQPSGDAAIDSEFLFGETVRVFDESAGWAWCQSEIDGYVGFVPSSALSIQVQTATHRVATLLTPLYPEPELRRPPLQLLSIGSRLTIVGTETVRDLDYALLEDGSAVVADHLRPVDLAIADDFVAVAEQFLGRPYIWAGRSGLGVDCSGLIQLGMMMTGDCPLRDSDMMENSIGEALDLPGDLPGDLLAAPPDFCRGDLIFWKGHVGVLTDPGHILHASGRTMSVINEPADELVARLEGKGLPVSALRRISR